MGAVALWTWVGVVVLGVVVIGFCGYEITWKLRRLHGDVETLTSLREALVSLQQGLADAQQSSAAIARQRAVNAHGTADRLFPHPKAPTPDEQTLAGTA